MMLIGLLMGAVVIHLVMVVPIAERAADEIQRTDQLEDQVRRLEGESRRARGDLERLEEELDGWRRQAEENSERLQLLTRMGWRADPMPARRIMVSARHHNVTLRPRPGENVVIPFLLSLSRMMWLQVSADELTPVDARDVPDIRARALSVEQVDQEESAVPGGEPPGSTDEGTRLSPKDGTVLSVELPPGGYAGILAGAAEMKIQTIILESIGEAEGFSSGPEADPEADPEGGGEGTAASPGGGGDGGGAGDAGGAAHAGADGGARPGGGAPGDRGASPDDGGGAPGDGDGNNGLAAEAGGEVSGDLIVFLKDERGQWHRVRLPGWGGWLNREIKLLLMEHNADG